MTAIATAATVASAIAGAITTDRYDCMIDAEEIGFTNCGTTTWTVAERGADATTPVSHVAGRPVVNALSKHTLENLSPPALRLFLAANFT